MSALKFDFKQSEKDEESFRWLDLSQAKVEDATLPIDRVVLGLLIERTRGRDGGAHAETQRR